jgi:hypothetical protein
VAALLSQSFGVSLLVFILGVVIVFCIDKTLSFAADALGLGKPCPRQNTTMSKSRPRSGSSSQTVSSDTKYNTHDTLPSLRNQPGRFEIIYLKGDGELTRRRVYIQKIRQGGGQASFVCYDGMRGAMRTFRGDRLKEIVDLRTGEVWDSGETYLRDLRERKKARQTQEARETSGE